MLLINFMAIFFFVRNFNTWPYAIEGGSFLSKIIFTQSVLDSLVMTKNFSFPARKQHCVPPEFPDGH